MTKRRALLLLAVLFSLATHTWAAVDRGAFTYTRYDLQATIDPARQSLAVKGTVTARNDSNAPQRELVLQISSSLSWQAVTVGGKPVQWLAQDYTSDIDHTGGLSEAIVTLPQAVAPQGTVMVDLEYSGTVWRNSTRLTRIGTPQESALRGDWDQIGDGFTAVRGLGYVTWYPVSIEAVSLSEGTSVFDALAAWKARHAGSPLNVTFTIPAGVQLVSNGDALTETEKPTHQLAVSFRGVGNRIPTFAMAAFQVTDRTVSTAYYVAEHASVARNFMLAAEAVAPWVTEWFGPQREKVRLVELTDPNTAPFDAGAFLFTPLRSLEEPVMQVAMAHQLVHSCFRSNRPWIEEGIAHFMQVVVRERQVGRSQAMIYLDQFMPQLAQIEREALNPNVKLAPQQRPKAQPLATTNDEFYYRTKASFVWVMLRDLAGEDALKRAIASYKPEQDTQPAYFQTLLETPDKPGSPKRDLEWFFDDWVYRDKGLPDFRVDTVYARPTLSNTYTVTVTVENIGTAAAAVPVGIRNAKGERIARLRVAPNEKAITRIQFPDQPLQVVINDGSVPESDLKNNTYDIPQTASPQ